MRVPNFWCRHGRNRYLGGRECSLPIAIRTPPISRSSPPLLMILRVWTQPIPFFRIHSSKRDRPRQAWDNFPARSPMHQTWPALRLLQRRILLFFPPSRRWFAALVTIPLQPIPNLLKGQSTPHILPGLLATSPGCLCMLVRIHREKELRHCQSHTRVRTEQRAAAVGRFKNAFSSSSSNGNAGRHGAGLDGGVCETCYGGAEFMPW